MKKVLVTGGTGLLGASLVPFLRESGYNIIVHGRSNRVDCQADFTFLDIAQKHLNKIDPDVIINLIGLTNVDFCEEQPNEAYLTNVRTVENIIFWIKQKKTNCHLIHISTDHVYDGVGPNKESEVSLKNSYAFSKYAGELVANSVSSTILRTNFFGCSHCHKRNSLTDWIYQSLSSNRSILVFDDVMFSPLSMQTLSEMIDLIIRKLPIGLFNLGSNEGMSKADFAFLFSKELGLPSDTMIRTKSDEVEFLKTYRPKDMRMDLSKIENVIGIKLPFLRDEIKKVANEYYEFT